MVIKNKDGTIFELNKVNPLMKEQDRWQNDWFVHYVSSEEIVIKDPKRVIPEILSEEIVPVVVGGGIVNPTEILYCLPLITRIEEDPIYNQSKQINSWGEKFSFEAVTIDYTGLTAVFLARVPEKHIAVGSIIYVFKERQWWKVNGTEELEDGVKIYCVPSELKPSFI